ncbi:MAG: DUF2723 domain-containing protein, partial [Elusimicrobiota bacterium]
MTEDHPNPQRLASPWILGALTFGLLALYLLGSYPTLSPYRDSGDLAAAALTLGVAHPPGYPVYVLLGKAWLGLLGLGNPAYRLQALSALLAAAACSVLFLSLARRTLAGAVAGFLILGFAPAFRHLSVVSEMYSLNALMAALILFLLREGPLAAAPFARRERPRSEDGGLLAAAPGAKALACA